MAVRFFSGPADENWCIEFVSGNRIIREATPFTKRSDTAEFLKQRHSDSLAGKIPALVAELASEQAALSAIQSILTARLLVTPTEHLSSDGGDRLLTAPEVAAMLGVTKTSGPAPRQALAVLATHLCPQRALL